MTARAAAPARATLTGRGLHSGRDCLVQLEAHDGPVVFRTQQGDASLGELVVERTDLGVGVRCPRVSLAVDSVEHLLSALGGLGLQRGVAITVVGEELPLADGAALAYAHALGRLGVAPSPPGLRVARAGAVAVGAAHYVFEPGEAVHVQVDVEFPPLPPERAAWDGSPAAYLRDVAWARTFGFRRDEAALAERGRARGVDPSCVMVLGDDGRVEPPGDPARDGELARHKLLDLIGDAFLLGGPPLGTVRATRPGHGATRRALQEALDRGLCAKIPRPRSG